ncbi:MAG TPA: hypothetical protein VGR25_10785 [bacterium]|jgi:hypothetical protein|nr:hypothetical protein [bacterium]
MAVATVAVLLVLVGYVGMWRSGLSAFFALVVAGGLMMLAVWRRMTRRSQFRLGRREKLITTGLIVAVLLYISWPLLFPR